MADTKVTGLTENTTPAATDIIYIVDDPGGTPASQKVTLANIKALVNDITTDAEWNAAGDLVQGTGANTAARLAIGTANQLLRVNAGATAAEWATIVTGGVETYAVCNGRLTLTTAVPVTTADVTAAATLYFTPFRGNQIGLYDGSTGWDILTFTELSLDISGYTASKPYDIWVYNNSGTATLDSTVWTNDTTRATALTTQDGIYVKTGATTRRYVGTIYINSSGGQTDDSVTKRNVWNYYNRRLKRLYKHDVTSHTYTTDAWRAWNNTTANSFQCVVGVQEENTLLMVQGSISASNAISGYLSIGYDVTNAEIEAYLRVWLLGDGTVYVGAGTSMPHLTGAGLHTYTAIEFGSTTVTFPDFTLRGAINC